MQGLGLRQKECVLCGTAIQDKGRIDRLYCSASCRTLAWRTRSGRRPHRSRAEVVANLRRGELSQIVTQMEAVLSAARDHIAALESPREDEPGVAAARNDMALRAELDSLRVALAEQRERFAQKEASLLDENVSLREAVSVHQQALQKAEHALEAQEQTIEQLRRQLTQTQAQREPSDAQTRRSGELSQQNTALRREVEQLRTSLSNAEQARKRARESELQQQRRIEAVEKEEKASRAKLVQLQAKIEQMKERAPKKDPLRFLMETKVRLLHQVALTNERIDVQVAGRRLPDESQMTFQAAVDYATWEARQQFYGNECRNGSDAKWIDEGYRLDPVNEEKLRHSEELAVGNLEYALSVARRKLR